MNAFLLQSFLTHDCPFRTVEVRSSHTNDNAADKGPAKIYAYLWGTIHTKYSYFALALLELRWLRIWSAIIFIFEVFALTKYIIFRCSMTSGSFLRVVVFSTPCSFSKLTSAIKLIGPERAGSRTKAFDPWSWSNNCKSSVLENSRRADKSIVLLSLNPIVNGPSNFWLAAPSPAHPQPTQSVLHFDGQHGPLHAHDHTLYVRTFTCSHGLGTKSCCMIGRSQ